MSQITLCITKSECTLKDTSLSKELKGTEILARLNALRTGTQVSIETKHKVVYDPLKTYYMLFDNIQQTVQLIYVNLQTHVVTEIARTSLQNPTDYFYARMRTLAGVLRILHSTNYRAYTVMYVADMPGDAFKVSKDGTVKIQHTTVILENTYRNIKGREVTERYLDLATAVQLAVRNKQMSQESRYAVVTEKGTVVFFL